MFFLFFFKKFPSIFYIPRNSETLMKVGRVNSSLFVIERSTLVSGELRNWIDAHLCDFGFSLFI